MLMALIKHPLLELTIEDQPFRMPLGKELRYLPILLN